ncbi:MAG: response regulator [Candidatus Binatia bacterium]
MPDKLKVLLVDDQPGYRRRLVKFLSERGCEVRTAADGIEAIALGTGYRPDVVVSAWLLNGRLHGVHVAEALRAMRPETRAVLLTESTTNLPPVEMADSDVAALIDRPPHPEGLIDVIRLAAASREIERPERPPALAHFGADGELLYANPSADELVDRCGGSKALWNAVADARHGPGGTEASSSVCDEWRTLPSAGDEQPGDADSQEADSAVHARVRQLDDGTWLVAFATAADLEGARSNAALRILMGGTNPAGRHFRLEGIGVIVDAERGYRELGCRVFHALGGICYPADSTDKAMDLLASLEGVRHVLVDHEAPGDVAGFLDAVAREWSDVAVIGQSRFGHRQSFSDMGVSRYIAKPWRLLELVAQLTSELGH